MLQWRSSQGRGILSKLMCGVQVWSIRHTSILSWGGHVEAGHRDTEKDHLTSHQIIADCCQTFSGGLKCAEVRLER